MPLCVGLIQTYESYPKVASSSLPRGRQVFVNYSNHRIKKYAKSSIGAFLARMKRKVSHVRDGLVLGYLESSDQSDMFSLESGSPSVPLPDADLSTALA